MTTEWRYCPVCGEDVSELFPQDGEHDIDKCERCIKDPSGQRGLCDAHGIDGPYWYEDGVRHHCPGCGVRIYMSVDREGYASILVVP